MVLHVFPLGASFSKTVNTTEGNGNIEKEGDLPVFDTDNSNNFFVNC